MLEIDSIVLNAIFILHEPAFRFLPVFSTVCPSAL